MPELPEVETIVRALRPELVGRTILSADLRWPHTLATPSAKTFKQRIKGLAIQNISRRAKYLILELENSQTHAAHNLIIHLRMSGDLLIRESKIKPEKHDRLILYLTPNPSPSFDFAHEVPTLFREDEVRGESKSLVFNDTRKFGRVWFTENADEVLGKLGPEPFSAEFTPQWLYENLHARHRQLKPLLLDQTFLAGLGNIYADECLHLAKLHPLAASDSVKRNQAAILHEAIRSVLEEGIRRNGASIDWVYRGGDYQNHFRVYGRAGQPCFVCGAAIEKLFVGQRGTHICPKCQRVR